MGSALEVPTDGFRVLKRPYSRRPAPVYSSTALQIGLLANPNVPDLIQHLLPKGAPAFASRFLRKWLIAPPPYDIAAKMRQLCSALLSLDTPTPTIPSVVPVRPPAVVIAICFQYAV